jgi:hypothetical protein
VISLGGKLVKSFEKVKNEFFQQAICQIGKITYLGGKNIEAKWHSS